MALRYWRKIIKYYILIATLFCILFGCNENHKRPIDDMDIKITGRMRLQSSLREPESLKIISEKLVKPGKYGGSVGYEAEYRSKNGFGGYVSETYYTE